jgi:dTDP-4-amino-4,6-dideoxygalactose transaminase
LDPIPFIDLAAQQARLRDRLDAALARVLDHGQYIMGPEVTELELALRARSGRRHALSCASGTDALVMALMALGVGPGDRVIVPDFTFVATAEAVRLVGAQPMFADIDPVSYHLDPDLLASAWSSESAVGIIAVDLFGHPARHLELAAIARSHGAWMIVDGAQSFGATRAGQSTLAHGELATTSFFPAKPLGAYGDGGAVFTDDDSLAEALRSIRLHGAGSTPYSHDRLGLTGRLDTIQAAILLTKLEIFDDEIERRLLVADRYADQLSDVVKPPSAAGDTVPVWAHYTIEVDDRDEVRDRLDTDGIPTGIYYPHPLHTQGPYRDDPVLPGGVTATEQACRRVLSLPMHPYLDPRSQDRVIDAVRAALGVH